MRLKFWVQFNLSFFPLLVEMNASDLLGFHLCFARSARQNLIGLTAYFVRSTSISTKINLSGFKNLIGYHPRQIEMHPKIF